MKLKKLGSIVAVCCLVASVPLVSTLPYNTYAAGSIIGTEVNITPPAGTSNISNYVAQKIEDALNTNDTITITGKAELNYHENPVTIRLANGKKVIWDADIKGSAIPTLIDLESIATTDISEFEIRGGSINSALGGSSLRVDASGNIKVTISGGELSRTQGSIPPTLFPTVLLAGKSSLDMRGGSISNYVNTQALVLQPSESTNYNITGGTIFSFGTENSTDLRTHNSVIKVDTPPNHDLANVNIGTNANVIAWDDTVFDQYNNNSLPFFYVAGGYDNRHILTYPNSNIKVLWNVDDNGFAVIDYKNISSGEIGKISLATSLISAEKVDFPQLPTNIVYDKQEHGIDNFNTHDNNYTIEYRDINDTVLTNKPVDAGEYKVKVKLSNYYGNFETELGKFKIDKKTITLKVSDKSIMVNETLPTLPQSFDDLTLTIEGVVNGDSKQDAITTFPTFTWGTDGSMAGTFNIGTTSPIVYGDNYKAGSPALIGTLTVTNPTSPSVPSNPMNPSNPSNPMSPSNPLNPSNQATPSNPSPSVPSNPNKPNDPNDPMNPSNPSNPMNPSNPSNPSNPMSPNDPMNPSTPSKPMDNSNSNSGSYGGGSSRNHSGSRVISGVKPRNNNKKEGEWILDSKGWWYQYPDKSWKKSEWAELKFNDQKDWYYFDEQGYMVTGWKMINDKWYYFYEKTEGNMPKGAMAQNTVINGYRVDSNGAWIK